MDLSEHFEPNEPTPDDERVFNDKSEVTDQDPEKQLDRLVQLLKELAPSIISLIGLGLVIHGSFNKNIKTGMIEVALGRLCDLVDGALARAFGVSNKRGAIIDALCDKIGVGVMVAQAWKRGVVPEEVLVFIIGSNVLNAGLSGIAQLRHPDETYETPEEGKQAMAAFNVSLITFLINETVKTENPDTHLDKLFQALGISFAAVGVPRAFIALGKYASRAVAPKQ